MDSCSWLWVTRATITSAFTEIHLAMRREWGWAAVAAVLLQCEAGPAVKMKVITAPPP
jgi:hypothetical protein